MRANAGAGPAADQQLGRRRGAARPAHLAVPVAQRDQLLGQPPPAAAVVAAGRRVVVVAGADGQSEREPPARQRLQRRGLLGEQLRGRRSGPMATIVASRTRSVTAAAAASAANGSKLS